MWSSIILNYIGLCDSIHLILDGFVIKLHASLQYSFYKLPFVNISIQFI